jgi:hypothetical protein
MKRPTIRGAIIMGSMVILFAVTNLPIWNMTLSPGIPAYTELYDMIWCRDVKLQSGWPWPKLGAAMAQAGVSSMSHLDNIYI